MKKLRLPSLGQARLAAFFGTIVTLLAYYLAPLKVLELRPHIDLLPGLFTDQHIGGKSEARWLDYQNTQWECIKRHSDAAYPLCGVAFLFVVPRSKTFDFSAFDSIYVHLLADETVAKIRMHLRNHNPIYSKLDDVASQKPNSISFLKKELENNTVKLLFSEFNVGDWWLEQYDIPRNLIMPEFDRLTGFSIEIAGEPVYDQPQTLRFEKLVLSGKWVPERTLYMIIVGVWVLILGADSCKQIYQFYRRSVANSKSVKYLTEYAYTLQKESEKYRELSAVDPLTGVFNRAGFANRVEGVLSGHREDISIGLIVFDIDHFKKVNDTFGHDAGDEILKGLADVVNASIRDTDTLARWGGEEFVILSVISAGKNLSEIGEKIRQKIQTSGFGVDGNLRVTISLGATTIREDEAFDTAFKRADSALYQAKSEGRNRLVFN